MPMLSAQWILPVDAPPIEDGVLIVAESGRIEALIRRSELPESASSPPPLPGSLLSPGLVNTHSHLEQSFTAPIPKTPETPFTDWLLTVVNTLRADSAPEARAVRCATGISELLRTGTTCVNDIASGTESIHALSRAGVRGIVSLEVFHPDFDTVNIATIQNACKRFRSAFPVSGSLLRPGLSPHSPYNVAPAAWQALLDACQPALVHTHAAEFEDEIRYLCGDTSTIPDLHQAILNRRFKPTEHFPSPVKLLARFGLLSPETVLAHCIHTNAEDRALIHQAGSRISHCPRSNLALHGQTLHAADWFGIPMGLGTDGRLSTEDLDLRAEARQAMAIHGTCHGWSASRALQAATQDGATVMGLGGETGSLTVGKWADCVLWQADPAALPPPHAADEDTLAALLLAPETVVREVHIAGRRVGKDSTSKRTPAIAFQEACR